MIDDSEPRDEREDEDADGYETRRQAPEGWVY
jgi:hypothetical protein